ncbi:hypothetical protein BDZ89DRAFT_1132530 [Hymenopellis radicata]|nr:hypothetical protein BDZ89DRAFT_1132530 [Hymenopellis radicata]
MIEQYNPHSPKYGELKRRDTKISMQIEWGHGRVALLDKKLKELEENAARQPAMDEERVKKMSDDIRQATREGRRPVEVLPLLECTYGKAESQELSHILGIRASKSSGASSSNPSDVVSVKEQVGRFATATVSTVPVYPVFFVKNLASSNEG